jgi:hypothetical protein
MCILSYIFTCTSHLHTHTSSSHIFTHLHTSSHIFTHLHTSSHIFTHLHTSSHIFTHLHTHSFTQQKKSAAEELLSHGANRDICDKKGRKPVDFARKDRPIWYLLTNTQPPLSRNRKDRKKKTKSSVQNRPLVSFEDEMRFRGPGVSITESRSEYGESESMNGVVGNGVLLENGREAMRGNRSLSTMAMKIEHPSSSLPPPPTLTYRSHLSSNLKTSYTQSHLCGQAGGEKASGGGSLGGGRALPVGTSKQVAIDDAVTSWLGPTGVFYYFFINFFFF